MPINKLQQQVDDWIRQYGVRYFDELTNMAILTEWLTHKGNQIPHF